MAQAVLNVVGTGTAQSYLHDAAYGMATLYMVLGKPYLGATEGNESAHVTMKKYFKGMCSHSSKRIGDALQLMNLLHMREWVIEAYGDYAKDTDETGWRLGGERQQEGRKKARSEGTVAIRAQQAHLEAQTVAEKGAERAEKP